MERSVIGQENTVQQQYPDTCAIKSQQIILQEFGIDVSESDLRQWSTDAGLYDGNGTMPGDVGKILAQAEIPCTQKVNANIFDLTSELAQGHKIIVGVDSGELWEPGIKEWFESLFTGDVPDHALIVAGIDNSDPANPMVLLTDPGTGQTCKPYPLDQFMDAWKDSGHFMVSTDISPADFASTQIANNQPPMHLADIGGQTYHDFQIFHDISQSLPPFTDWNYQLYPQYPVGSLMDAYLAGPEAHFSDYYFSNFVDGSTFVSNYADTFDTNIDNLGNHDAITDMTAFIHTGPDADALHSYFETQAGQYTALGDSHTAGFFAQQANFIDCCHALGIDPAGFYDNYDFNGIL